MIGTRNAIRERVMMSDQTSEKAEVKMYSDFKSPYAYLAFDPGMALGQRFDVRVRWIPFQLRLKGRGERSVHSEYKVKYSYMDARRWAKPRGLWIRGPLKIYDTTPAAIGGLFAETQDRKSTRLNSSHLGISYAVFCLKKQKKRTPVLALGPTHVQIVGRAWPVSSSKQHVFPDARSTTPECGRLLASVPGHRNMRVTGS